MALLRDHYLKDKITVALFCSVAESCSSLYLVPTLHKFIIPFVLGAEVDARGMGVKDESFLNNLLGSGWTVWCAQFHD